MEQQPVIKQLPRTILAGQRLQMSFTDNRTTELWQRFMPRRKAIRHARGTDLYSVEVYEPGYFRHFNPARPFEKWAAVAVEAAVQLPEDMELLTLPEGRYAVFVHRGPASSGPDTYRYIFTAWLPASGYQLDDRPHFALMGDRYRHEAPDSEEELWIPLRS